MAVEFHCVSIGAGPRSCQAAQQVENIRYLSREAPSIPLAGCADPDACRCRYRHYQDRRAGSRRGTDLGLAATAPTPSDRRGMAVGRRASDRQSALAESQTLAGALVADQ